MFFELGYEWQQLHYIRAVALLIEKMTCGVLRQYPTPDFVQAERFYVRGPSSKRVVLSEWVCEN